ncbi:hypothetical protein [Caballeronia ptereochthonis]|uniref:Uncharacterized protein n=1 Tax=Caballeronia ptereochthonis TaxID=1777144 RepID=A0A158CGW3_9BURK|nr:hypothetical protein [Caballeronia ptereochthonis]SAK81613.1 hypothetical protein AWB83_04331 [Caballeronia ptereochthonis]
MPINGIQSDAYADLGEAWIQDQSARLMQKHLQFGQHYRIDVDALLARSAQVARAARIAAAAAENLELATDRIRRATLEAVEHCPRLEDPFVQMSRLPQPPESGVQSISTAEQPNGPESAILGEFSRANRLGADPRDEWVAVLADLTEVVVADVRGRPSALGIAKATSIVQSRAYIETRARQLLKTLTRDDGDWSLIVIDFGVEAQHHDCEFLMCFVFQAANSDLSATSPYAEIGFALLKQSHATPIFVLTIRTATGFDVEPAIRSQDCPSR